MTVQDLVTKSLQLIGVVASGETPATSESNDAFDALNLIIANWNAQQLPLYSVSVQTVTMTGAASYALSTRVSRIKSAQVVSSIGTTQAPNLIDAAGWAGVTDKARTGVFAEVLYCDYAFPSATVWLSPKPTAGTLEVFSYTPLTAFGSLGATITLPPGYERALRYALAIELAPEYGRPLGPEILVPAQEAKGAITGLNAVVLGEMQPASAATAQPAA